MGAALKVGGNYYNDTYAIYLTAAYANYSYPWYTNPKTGTHWTVDEINGIGVDALEAFGVYSNDATPTVSCSQCYLEVGYYYIAVNVLGSDMPVVNYGESRFTLWTWIVVKLPNDMGVQVQMTVDTSKWGYARNEHTTALHDADGSYLTFSCAHPWIEPADVRYWIWANRAGVELVYRAWGVYCTRMSPYGAMDSKTVSYTAHWDYEIPFVEAAMTPYLGEYDIFHAWDGGAEAAGAMAHWQYVIGDPWVSQVMTNIELLHDKWLGKAYLADESTAEVLPSADQWYFDYQYDAADYLYRMDTIVTQVDLPDDTGGCSGDPICVWGSVRRCHSGGGVTIWSHTYFARKVGGLWDVQLLDATSSRGGYCFSRGDEVAVFTYTGGAYDTYRSTDRGATWALSGDVWPGAVNYELLYVPMSDTLIALVWDAGTALWATQRSTDFGATWDVMVDIVGTDDDHFTGVMHAQFCHDEAGGIHIVTHNAVDDLQINHWHSHDLGATWTENATVLDANLLPFPDYSGFPLVFAEGGKVLVAIDHQGNMPATDWGGTYVLYAVSTDGGNTFGAQAWATMPDRACDCDGLAAQMYGGEVYLYYAGWYDDAPGLLWGHYPGDVYYATFYVKSTGWETGIPIFTDPGGGEILNPGMWDYTNALMPYRIDPSSQLSAAILFEPASWYLQYTVMPLWGWWNWSGHIYEMNPTDWGPLIKTQDPGWRSSSGASCSQDEYFEYSLYGTAHMWLMQRHNPWIQHI
jgi:hypothetical protein